MVKGRWMCLQVCLCFWGITPIDKCQREGRSQRHLRHGCSRASWVTLVGLVPCTAGGVTHPWHAPRVPGGQNYTPVEPPGIGDSMDQETQCPTSICPAEALGAARTEVHTESGGEEVRTGSRGPGHCCLQHRTGVPSVSGGDRELIFFLKKINPASPTWHYGQWGRITLLGGCPGHCRALSSVPGLHSLHARSISSHDSHTCPQTSTPGPG